MRAPRLNALFHSTRSEPGGRFSLWKKTARMLRRLKGAPGLDENERFLWARSLAASPAQRWDFNLAALRFYNSFPASVKDGFRSK